jgi:hypothetical protein
MTFFQLETTSKIFISCPANCVTGGPEALHQLGHKLRLYENAGVYMFYYNKQDQDPIAKEYKFYNVPYVDKVEDNPQNVLIVPEVKTSLIYQFPKTQKGIWWLSVDNFFKSKRSLKKLLKDLLTFSIKAERVYNFSSELNLIHLVQSEYARSFLKSKQITDSQIEHLSDYLNTDFLKAATDSLIKKEDWIAYNPRKGFEFTQHLIEAAPELEWKPIQNMTRAQVIDLLKKSKVYIDFGNHPGKDRIPREAAICNCCVITGRKGSAAFYEDVPIQDEFKFSDELSIIPNIIRKIRTCLSNHEHEVQKQDNYRDIIRHEEQVFEKDVRRIFFGETPKGQVTT